MKDKTRLWQVLLFVIVCLMVVWGIIGTWVFPRTPEHDKLYPPDWVLRWVGIVFVFVAYIVIIRIPKAIRIDSAFAKAAKEGLIVGYYQCPECSTRFCGEGYCPACPGFPSLKYREEIWKRTQGSP